MGVNDGKYLALNGTTGREEKVDAINQSAGVSDAGKIAKLNAVGRWDQSMMPVGVGPDTAVVPAFEALSAGNYVNLFVDAGVVKARLADGSNGRDAHGFVKNNFAMAANATIYFEGANDGLTGLTPGIRYYLGTAGAPVSVPRATGVHQFLGLSISATAINTDISDGIDL